MLLISLFFAITSRIPLYKHKLSISLYQGSTYLFFIDDKPQLKIQKKSWTLSGQTDRKDLEFKAAYNFGIYKFKKYFREYLLVNDDDVVFYTFGCPRIRISTIGIDLHTLVDTVFDTMISKMNCLEKIK
eukprot:NODE_158_length_15065_cov_0.349125.p12 type:complete len:129 gc:universal NODE_158_length_15065_cov_0.349125:10045-10431(+)